MRWRARAATLAVVAVTGIVFALAAPHFKFSTKITEFLPDDKENRGAQIAALLAESELSKVMVIDLSLTVPSTEKLAAAALALETHLKALPDVAMARSGFTDTDLNQMMTFLAVWPPTTFLPSSAYTEPALRARLSDLKEQLGGPMGVMIRQTAPRDPLGGTWEPLQALRSSQGNAIIDEDGVVYTPDHLHAFVFVETRSSSFDSDAQRAFREVLDDWLAANPGVTMQTAGAAQFAIASEAQIKGDVNRIGIVSTIGILLIFLALFGSVRMILVGFVPMIFGSAVAVLACQLIFGEIHGITIAFGTSLLGVGLDYVEHYYAHFVLTPEVPAKTTMKIVAPSIVLGAVTTIIGFVGLAAAGLGGLRQMAVFSVIAIVASMASTIWMVPPWMPVTYKPPRTLAVVDRVVFRLMKRLTSRTWSKGARIAILVGAVVIMAAGVRVARFSDNVNMLVSDKGAHVVQDTAVRSRLGPESSTFAVITAGTDEALLIEIGRATDELEAARGAGGLTSFVPLGRILPSASEQVARFTAARTAVPVTRKVMEELEFVPDQFTEYWTALQATAPKVLSLGDVRSSPLAPLLAAWVPAQTMPIALIPLVGVKDVAALQALVPSATIVAPSQTIVDLFRGVRIRTVVSSLLGLAAILLLLLARYRSLRKVVVAVAPAILACVAAVGTMVAMGISLNILHVMSLLLVVSLGVDFGIFFVDTNTSLEEAARTMVSIITASLTTILSFGLLGLSSSPGLAAIGVTVTLGVTFSLLTCFLMASLAGPKLVAKEPA
jgi:predicted exporter